MKGRRYGDLRMLSTSDFASTDSPSELLVSYLLELKWWDGRLFSEIREEDGSAADSSLRVVRGEDCRAQCRCCVDGWTHFPVIVSPVVEVVE